MSARCNGPTHLLTHNGGPAGAATIMGWFYVIDRNGYGTFMQKDNNSVLQTMGDGLGISLWEGNTETQNATFVATSDAWYHIALVSDGNAIGNQMRAYVNGALAVSANRPYTAATNKIELGNATQWSDYLNGRIANVFVYDAALTVEEIAAQVHLGRPQRLANLWAWWLPPGADGANRLIDWSGNGRALSEVGITDADNPAVAYSA